MGLLLHEPRHARVLAERFRRRIPAGCRLGFVSARATLPVRLLLALALGLGLGAAFMGYGFESALSVCLSWGLGMTDSTNGWKMRQTCCVVAGRRWVEC